MIGLKPIGPHETINIDVKKLRDEQIPDERGRTIPLYISSGQLQWSLRRKDNLPDDDTRANLSLIGRSEQVDLAKGIVNNYSCMNCCAGNHVYGFITPSSAEIEYGETAHFIAIEAEETCYGFPYEFSIGANWTSSDSSLGTISGGDITAAGVGQTSIGASWSTHSAFADPCPPGGGGDPPLFALIAFNQNRGEACKSGKERRGGPYISDVESYNTEFALPLRPECGTCQYRGFTFTPPIATLTVKPKVTINVPSSAKDGDTATFSVTAQGNTPSSYQWSFESPSGAGNSPQVNFNSPTAASSTASAHWFALPNNPCSASADSRYEIKVAVRFQNGSEITKGGTFNVNGYWNPAGQVDPNQARVTGVPSTGPDASGIWRVTGMGTLARQVPTKVVFVPTVSQFFNKADQHEQEHLNHWGAGNLLGSAHQPTDFYNRIVNFTGTSYQDLLNQIIADFQIYTNLQDTFVNQQHNESERRAYAVSDPISPQFLYQNCGRY